LQWFPWGLAGGGFGPKVFDIPILTNQNFAEATFLMLGLDQGLLNGGVGVDGTIELEFFVPD
jgi:hypothetical protein